MVLRWEAPPARGQLAAPVLTDWQDLAQELRSNPGEWALVLVKPNSTGANNAKAYLQGTAQGSPFRRGEFEVVSRSTSGPGKQVGVWAKFAGRKR